MSFAGNPHEPIWPRGGKLNSREDDGFDAVLRKSSRPSMETKDISRRAPVKKSTPPEQTNAEQFYYSKQMQGKTPMVIALTDGEVVEGVVEWYDRTCIKLNRDGAPNLLLYKHCIKYIYKAGPDEG